VTGYEITGLALVMFSLGIFLGHAAGYLRARDAMRLRIRRRARYRRVGHPE
jgi:hypothetical protein